MRTGASDQRVAGAYTAVTRPSQRLEDDSPAALRIGMFRVGLPPAPSLHLEAI